MASNTQVSIVNERKVQIILRNLAAFIVMALKDCSCRILIHNCCLFSTVFLYTFFL